MQLGEGNHVLEQAPRIERSPHAVGDRSGPVSYHDVVVELGVPGPRIPVGEGGRHHALDVLLDHTGFARTGVEDLAFGVGENDLDGLAVAGIDRRFGIRVGQCPGHRDRLGR